MYPVRLKLAHIQFLLLYRIQLIVFLNATSIVQILLHRKGFFPGRGPSRYASEEGAGVYSQEAEQAGILSGHPLALR